MGPRGRSPSGVGVTLCGILLGAMLAAVSLTPAQAADGRDVSDRRGPVGGSPSGSVGVWLTDLAGKAYLARQPDLAWRRDGMPAGATVAVDETRKYQRMEGFGASFTDSSAWLVGTRLDPQQRDRALRDLFSARDGIGLSFLRQPMGASDFAVEGNYSYDDLPPGGTDPTLARFSIEHDKAYAIPVLKKARALNPRLTLMASPWSPPGWMKTSDSMIGGTLKAAAYQPFALYFAKFLKAYAAEGLPVSYISLNNEPLYVPSGYPGMSLSAEQARDLIRDHVGPTLRERGLSTRILGYDHNWDVLSYPESLYADRSVEPYVAGTAWHCYGGDVRAQSVSHNNYPNKPAYHTECSGGEWEGGEQEGFAGAIGLVINASRDWAKAVVRWNIALDDKNGPTNGGCLTCRGVITVAQDAKGRWGYSKTVDYYALGHASKFVRPGARRIASSTLGKGSIEDVAFVNPDGSKVLLAHNSGDSRRTFQVRWGQRWFAYTLAAGAAATFTWSGPQQGKVDDAAIGSVDLHFDNPDGSRATVSYDAGLTGLQDQARIGDAWLGYSLPTGASLEPPAPATPLDRSGWSVSASASSPEDPPGKAIDGDPATRWSTGHGMTPGDWFQIDLGSTKAFSELHLNTAGSPGDFVRGYEVYVSNDGMSWGQAIARGGGRTDLRVMFPTVEARYVRVVNTGSSGSWWSIHEVNVLTAVTATAPATAAIRTEAGRTLDVAGTSGEGLQRKSATLPDGTRVDVVYNAGRAAAAFDVTWGSTTYRYRLPAGAAAAFTEER
ncbi:discoidin domain-containing protein [Actinopolymorpha alba]|uniref:discoidin domain-containing protein n=1 Tax=Actinopolymorpha alba TaxID=533267 RepID=UPI0012F634BD|nr:discoidin domain-containing protein [Actinopolymorpha alba]